MDGEELIARIEADIRPLCDVDKFRDGYNCCGCSTYDAIIDDIITLIRTGETPVFPACETHWPLEDGTTPHECLLRYGHKGDHVCAECGVVISTEQLRQEATAKYR